MDKAIELNKQCDICWNKKGLILAEKERYEEAIKAYDKAIELDPEYLDAWNNKGIALVKGAQNYIDAIKCFDKAIEINGKRVEAWVNKGNTYTMMGRDSDADYAFAKAAELGYVR